VTEDIALQVLRILKENPRISQRELAKALGISLGKVNYCVRALIEKGWVKTKNFRTSKNKLAYAYLLTPEGLKQKKLITISFLNRKIKEFEAIKLEIARLTREVETQDSAK